jgi:hypothetical protein
MGLIAGVTNSRPVIGFPGHFSVAITTPAFR